MSRKNLDTLQIKNVESTESKGPLLENIKDIKDLIAPSGIDASSTNHLEIFSNTNKYARTMIISVLPRMCTFPEFLRSMYTFGDINVSVFINPISEAKSQNELNKVINTLESERIVAKDRGNINRESELAQKRIEAEELRDAIAAGMDKLYESSIICTLFAYDMEELDRRTELLTSEMSKTLVELKAAWAQQEQAFQSNMPFNNDKLGKKHTFDRRSMSTVFPFINSDVGHEGEYGVVAEALGGVNIVISPNSNTIINPFDVEPEIVRDEITGKEQIVLNVENKIEDVTQIILTMARGSTKSEDVNEVTKQIISEAIAEEYSSIGVNNNVNSLYAVDQRSTSRTEFLGRKKKAMPTMTSWYKRIVNNARANTNEDYRFHYSYLVKVMRQYVREYNGPMSYFDGQSTFDLLDGTQFINMDISQLEERFARPLAQQILLSWIWEKYVKKNSEDKSKAGKKRVLVDEAWMLLPFPEAVDFLNKMARRARKRNVSLAVVSQRFQDFYEKSEVQAVLTSSDTKLFLAQDKSEIQYIQEIFKLSEGEASFLTTCARGEGLFKVGEQTAIIEIRPTKKELEFIETNINKIRENK